MYNINIIYYTKRGFKIMVEANKIFNVDYYPRVQNLKDSDLKLAHYTSASVALEIIKNKEIWLNNVGNMNDYQEVITGKNLLAETFNKTNEGNRLKTILNKISDKLSEELIVRYNSIFNALDKTYAFCLTEHKKAYDKYGRLSMWRAYAPKNGVALVLNIEPFIEDSNKTKARTLPMFYYDYEEFQNKFKIFVDEVENNFEIFKKNTKEEVLDFFYRKFLISVLSLKHKGFEEEKEWRILCNDIIYIKDNVIKEDIKDVRGVPRIIKILNFDSLNDENSGYSTKLNDILYKIIIGPSDNPEQLRDIFIKKLDENDVFDAEKKVVISEIPVRI